MMTAMNNEVFNKKEVLSGLELTKSNYQQLNFLIQNEEDCVAFWDIWMENKCKQAFAVIDFRKYMIDNNPVEFEEFMKDYMKNPLVALGNLFKHPMVESDMNHINKWIEKGNTLTSLYEEHKKNPHLTLFQITV